MTTPLVVEFNRWLKNNVSGDIDDGGRAHGLLQDAFDAGAKIGLAEGTRYGKEQAIYIMRKYFDAEMDSVLDALAKEIR